MEYAEASAGRGVFYPPQGIRTNLPEEMPSARMVVKCTLYSYGNLKGIRVLKRPRRYDCKVLAALRS
jgi:hypothetical protein